MASTSSPSLANILTLLRGDRDEQKLAGLLLATKLCHGEGAAASVLQVYRAVGVRFLDRLLLTGLGKLTGSGVSGGEEDREAYLKLSVTVLAGFCRVQEIASEEEIVSKVPVVAEILSKSVDPSVFEECYEFFYLVAAASENGRMKFLEPGVMDMVAPHIAGLNDGSQPLESAMRLLQLILNQLPIEMVDMKYIPGIAQMVVCLAKQFAVLQNALKFDALHLLATLLSSRYSPLHDALRSIPSDNWASDMRVGIATILQNRVVSTEKLQVLLLAESMMAILGENWLLETKTNDNLSQMTVDKYLLLVLETTRVEVAVHLNELAYLKYEAAKTSATSESIQSKQRNLAVSFSLLERIIKLMSNVCVAEVSSINEHTLTKMIVGLNETVSLILDFLQDAKDHGQRKGDDLLAAVRIIGSYLAETPYACMEKTRGLLEYILSIEGDEETSPFCSVCFLLPMLCQITVEIDGCKVLASFEGQESIIECIVKMIQNDGAMVEKYGTIYLACETILNFLLKTKEVGAQLKEYQIIRLLQALALWAENSHDSTTVMLASSICALLFDLTSQVALLNHSNFDSSTLESLSELIAGSFSQVEVSYDVNEELDLHEIITTGYHRWADRFPLVRNAVEAALTIC